MLPSAGPLTCLFLGGGASNEAEVSRERRGGCLKADGNELRPQRHTVLFDFAVDQQPGLHLRWFESSIKRRESAFEDACEAGRVLSARSDHTRRSARRTGAAVFVPPARERHEREKRSPRCQS
ncbi:hypothetical protein EYF80_023977 [Liparis tanakae]|uniref:Uncharacterized protein n=1 Tax=Liparis tanakae TaxID=230148 RepID=A0A4Z2HKK0_9TELE|nr:hypothetical protein EYF80_023977 [Liparis tanakae]